MTDMKISIFIPAYNTADFLAAVVEKIPGEVWQNVESCWVINDGSRDNTGVIAEELARANGRIKAVHFEKNSGYGAVVKKGLSLCKEDRCDIAVCLHGDGQYPADMIPEFVDCMIDRKFDILQGSRHAANTAIKGGMPLYKYIAGKLLTKIENAVFGLSMTDYHSGFMFYSWKALEMIPYDRFSMSFEIDLEMIAAARSLGLSIGEKPIPTHYGKEVSYLSPVVYGICVLNVLRQYLTGKYRRQ